jgi:hypothetical protein
MLVDEVWAVVELEESVELETALPIQSFMVAFLGDFVTDFSRKVVEWSVDSGIHFFSSDLFTALAFFAFLHLLAGMAAIGVDNVPLFTDGIEEEEELIRQ